MIIKKIYKYALFSAALLSGVSVAMNTASAGVTSQPGCDQGYYTALESRANAKRVLDHAYATELILQTNSTLAMSCFDQAVVNSAKGAFIFADVSKSISEFSSSSDSVLNTGWATNYSSWVYPGSAITEMLIVHLDNIIESTLENILDNFDNSASFDYFTAAPLPRDSVLGDNVGGASYSGHESAVNGFSFDCSRMGELWFDNSVGTPLSIVGEGIWNGASIDTSIQTARGFNAATYTINASSPPFNINMNNRNTIRTNANDVLPALEGAPSAGTTAPVSSPVAINYMGNFVPTVLSPNSTVADVIAEIDGYYTYTP